MKLIYTTPELITQWKLPRDIVTLSESSSTVEKDFELDD